jgi:hypothetical protein
MHAGTGSRRTSCFDRAGCTARVLSTVDAGEEVVGRRPRTIRGTIPTKHISKSS